MSSGATLHAANISVKNLSWSASASGNCWTGMTSSGSRCAAIDATLTIAAPSAAVAKKASFTFTVPSALVFITYSASPMLGLTPAVWMTALTVPSAAAASNTRSTAARSVTSALTIRAAMPRSPRAVAAASSRSCRTSHNITVWSRPTTLAVASPMPPAPPVITVTCVMACTVYRRIRGPASGLGSWHFRGQYQRPAVQADRPAYNGY